MLTRTATDITFRNEITKKLETYQTYAEFPFDSNRKRMSMVVGNGKKYYLMCKGADNIMLPRIDFHKEQPGLEKKIEFHLH